MTCFLDEESGHERHNDSYLDLISCLFFIHFHTCLDLHPGMHQPGLHRSHGTIHDLRDRLDGKFIIVIKQDGLVLYFRQRILKDPPKDLTIGLLEDHRIREALQIRIPDVFLARAECIVIGEISVILLEKVERSGGSDLLEPAEEHLVIRKTADISVAAYVCLLHRIPGILFISQDPIACTIDQPRRFLVHLGKSILIARLDPSAQFCILLK